jgi:phage tail sheath protein FI
MVEIRYPGVYLNEVATGSKPIEGVQTATPAGPSGKTALEHLEHAPTLADRVRRAEGIAHPDPDFKYVSIRRYVAFLEESIQKGLQFAVFEPNNEALWANVRATISDFLMNEWCNGLLVGTRPDQAFFVRCDRSTMTQDDIDNGRLVVEIGVATTKPAEFVIVRIGSMTGLPDGK